MRCHAWSFAALLMVCGSVATADPPKASDLLLYSTCTIMDEPIVDDGRPDAKSVAKRLAWVCRSQYRIYVTALRRSGYQGHIQSSFSIALDTVLTERQNRRQRNSN
jgi:hypothetical protein